MGVCLLVPVCFSALCFLPRVYVFKGCLMHRKCWGASCEPFWLFPPTSFGQSSCGLSCPLLTSPWLACLCKEARLPGSMCPYQPCVGQPAVCLVFARSPARKEGSVQVSVQGVGRGALFQVAGCRGLEAGLSEPVRASASSPPMPSPGHRGAPVC